MVSIETEIHVINHILYRMRHSKVGLRLGSQQRYYISRYDTEEVKGVKLTITAVGNDADSVQQRWELIQFIDEQLINILKMFMPAEKKPLQYIPCPHCVNLHIKIDQIGTPTCCPHTDEDTPAGYYTELLPPKTPGK